MSGFFGPGFFAGGRFADVVLGFVLLEAAGLFLMRRLAGQGPGLGAMLPTLLAGGFLVLAVRLAVSGAAPLLLAASLLAALAAHAVDLRRRWVAPQDVAPGLIVRQPPLSWGP